MVSAGSPGSSGGTLSEGSGSGTVTVPGALTPVDSGPPNGPEVGAGVAGTGWTVMPGCGGVALGLRGSAVAGGWPPVDPGAWPPGVPDAAVGLMWHTPVAGSGPRSSP